MRTRLALAALVFWALSQLSVQEVDRRGSLREPTSRISESAWGVFVECVGSRSEPRLFGQTLLGAEPKASERTKLDVTYKTMDQGPLRLGLHYPTQQPPDTGYPLVVFTHGGG